MSLLTTHNPIIVPRQMLVPHIAGSVSAGSTAALYAPPPPTPYHPSAPTVDGAPTPSGGSHAAIFSAIGESLLGDDFAEQTLWWV